MEKNKNNDQSIIDEIIDSLNINEKNNKSRKNSKEKNIVKKSTYKPIVKDNIKEEYEIIMDCDNSGYFVYYRKK